MVGALLGVSMIVALREDLVDLDDAALDPRLLVLGVVVLGVLGDVAELLGFLDALADLTTANRLEVAELVLELGLTLGSERDLLVHELLLSCRSTAQMLLVGSARAAPVLREQPAEMSTKV